MPEKEHMYGPRNLRASPYGLDELLIRTTNNSANEALLVLVGEFFEGLLLSLREKQC